MAPKILLTTTVGWPFAARLAGAFAKAGCEVGALAPLGHLLFESRHVGWRSRYRPFAGARCLGRAVAQFAPDLAVPCDDRALTHMLQIWTHGASQQHRPTLALLERSLGLPSVYGSLLARTQFIQKARALGVRAPETHDAATESDLVAIADTIGFPSVLKVDNSWGGEGVRIVDTALEARAAYRRLQRRASVARALYRSVARKDWHHLAETFGRHPRRLSVQAFVPGAAATSAIACWEGEVLAANHFDTVATRTPRGPASVVRRVDDQDMNEAAARIARHFRLSGLIGLDFVRDGHGRTQLIEINPRATPTAHLALGPGRDLIGALVSRFDGGALRERPAITACDTIALYPQGVSRDPESANLKTAYHDLPFDDPALMPDAQMARIKQTLTPSTVPTS